MRKTYTHIELLDRFMSGKTSPEEEQTLLAWFSDPDHKEEIMAFYKSRWEESSGKKLPPKLQGQMFCEIKKRIRQEEKTLEIKKKPHTLWKWLSYAAVALICIGLGIGSHWYNMRQVPPPDPLDYVVLADNGQRASVVLPDGTKVWLNSHTKLNYRSDYGVKERSVSLSGEAYFEVSKDTLRRFLVNAGDMEVEALGTAFNVKAYEEDDEVVTTLFEGSVRTAVGKEFVILSPDESAVFNKSSHILSVNHPTNASYARLWRTNELAFSGESLEEIAVLLNRMYNVEVRFLSNKIKGYSFSGVIRNNSLDNVFEIISLTAPITYVSVGDTIYLNEK